MPEWKRRRFTWKCRATRKGSWPNACGRQPEKSLRISLIKRRGGVEFWREPECVILVHFFAQDSRLLEASSFINSNHFLLISSESVPQTTAAFAAKQAMD